MCQGLTKNRVIWLLKSYAIALITVESAGKGSFIYSYMQPRLKDQYNAVLLMCQNH